MYSTLLALVILGAALWFWRDSLRAREAAQQVSRRACQSEGVQFLDETVSLLGLRLSLARGRMQLKRVYGFEFSRRGDDRQTGSVTLTGARVDSLFLAPAPELADRAPRVSATIVDLESKRRH